MYSYDKFDQQLVDERVEQFRDQVSRRLKGELSEDEFKPLGYSMDYICNYTHICLEYAYPTAYYPQSSYTH